MQGKTRWFVLALLATIAYVPVSVYFYGNGPGLLHACFELLWFPLLGFNLWAIGSGLAADSQSPAKWSVALIAAFVLSVVAAIVFAEIAFNTYGT